MDFGQAATRLARNPLGIIALFLAVVYTIATSPLLLNSSLPEHQREVLVWFVVLFPVLVLGVFAWLVACHHTKLYGPGDFKDERLFQTLLSPEAQRERLSSQVRQSVASEALAAGVEAHEPGEGRAIERRIHVQANSADDEHRSLQLRPADRYFLAEELVIRKLEAEWNAPISRQVGINGLAVDGLLVSEKGMRIVEVKLASALPLAVAEGALEQLESIVRELKRNTDRFRVMLALVLGDTSMDVVEVGRQLLENMRSRGTNPHIEVRVFSLATLAKEFGLQA